MPVLTLPPLPRHVGTLNDEAFAQAIEAGAPEHPFPCLTCGATSRDEPRDIDVLDEHGQVVRYRCDCIGQFKLRVNLCYCGIPKLYQRLVWRDLDAVPATARHAAESYLRHLGANIRQGQGLVFHGPPGTGKSSLSYLIAREVYAEGHDVFAIDFQGFIDRYTRSWGSDAEAKAAADWFERRIRRADVLVLDDVAKEYAGRGKVVEPLLDFVLRYRVQHEKPTIISSNQDLAGLSRAYSINFSSLLTEVSRVVHVDGEDYRPRVAERRIDEQDAGLARPVLL